MSLAFSKYLHSTCIFILFYILLGENDSVIYSEFQMVTTASFLEHKQFLKFWMLLLKPELYFQFCLNYSSL